MTDRARLRGAAIAAIGGVAVAVPLVLGGATSTAGGPSCLGKTPTIVRGDEDNDIQGTAEADVIVAGGGDDSVEAHGGKDRVCSGSGNDLVFTGPANDKVAAGNGRDEVHGVGGSDLLMGGKGDDSGSAPHALAVTIDAGLYGGDGADELEGGPGTDRCEGEAGNDSIDCELD